MSVTKNEGLFKKVTQQRPKGNTFKLYVFRFLAEINIFRVIVEFFLFDSFQDP